MIRNSRRKPKLKPAKIHLKWILVVFLMIALISITLSVKMLLVPSFQVQEKELNAVSRHEENSLVEKYAEIYENSAEGSQYSMVFSTGCTPLQHWQSLLFFYYAHKVKQPGNVTRIASGCSKSEASKVRRTHQEKVAKMSERFHLHITPDYGFRDNKKYWNKPHGLLDWLENEMEFSHDGSRHDDVIIIILDPDMILLKPITNEFTDFKEDRRWKGKKLSEKVVHGIPFAQAYGFGSSWLTSLKGKLSDVVGEKSPALDVNLDEASKYFPAGPPYLATGKDMYALVTHWVKFLPRVHSIFPEFMAEMHAYSIAAAHLQLPHQLAKGFMISDVGAAHKEDAFSFLDNTSRAEACGAKIPPSQLPFVHHYCQRYAIGRWFFSKYKLPEDFFDCRAQLLKEPPLNVAEIYDWYIFPNGIEMNDYSSPKKQHFLLKHAWMMCETIFSLNEAATELKKAHCGAGANYEKTFHFHEEAEFQAMLQNGTKPF